MKRIAIAPLLAATLLLTACTGGTPAAAKCIPSTTIVDRVAIAFLDDASATGRYGTSQYSAVDGSIMVAVEYLSKDTTEPLVGVWYSAKIEGAQIYSVDENARKISDWGQGAEGVSKKQAADAGYEAALACLK